jgi:hypothetical protein
MATKNLSIAKSIAALEKARDKHRRMAKKLQATKAKLEKRGGASPPRAVERQEPAARDLDLQP